MRFIRENLFLVGLVAFVVVIGTIMLIIEVGFAGDVDKQLDDRARMAKELASLERKSKTTPVNEDILRVKRQTALAHLAVVKEFEDLQVAWNLHLFHVMQLPVFKLGSLTFQVVAAPGARADENTDILNVRGLVSALRGDASYPPQDDSHRKMAAHVWGLLPEATRKQMPKEGAEPNREQMGLLLAGLNAVLRQPDLFKRQDFPRVVLREEVDSETSGPDAAASPKEHDLVLPEAVARILRKRREVPPPEGGAPVLTELSGLDVQRLNRLVLSAFWPDLITSGQIPAFPIDADRYRRHGLPFTFQQQYHEVLDDLLIRLEPTRAPSATEISREIERWTKLKARWEEREALLKRKREMEKTAPGAEDRLRPPMDEGMMPGFMPIRRRPTGPSRTETKGQTPAEEEQKIDPKELGEQTARIRKAREGRIFASMSSFVMVFPPGVPQSDPPESDLWKAQLGLWITQDIVEAIIQTNEEVLGKLEPKDRNVLSAPVKQLVAVQVLEKPDDRSTSGRPRQSLVERLGAESMVRPTTPGATTPTQAPSLTQRVSNIEYDVIPYSFVVVMPTRYLPRLEQNLYATNYHTILNVTMTDPAAELRKDYFYGVDPIMQVQIDGELPMLAVWTRGKWNADKNEWLTWDRNAKPTRTGTAPAVVRHWQGGDPLMPVDAVRSLVPQSAWRPEDRRRVSSAAMTDLRGGRMRSPDGF